MKIWFPSKKHWLAIGACASLGLLAMATEVDHGSNNASEGFPFSAIDDGKGNHDPMLDTLSTGGGGLRGGLQLEDFKAITEDIKDGAPVGELSLVERAALTKKLNLILDNAADEAKAFSESDLEQEGVGLELQQHVKEAAEVLEGIKGHRDKVVGFVERASQRHEALCPGEETDQDGFVDATGQNGSTNPKKDNAKSQYQRRTKEEDSYTENGSNNWNDWSTFPINPFKMFKGFHRGQGGTQQFNDKLSYKSKSGASSLLGTQVSRSKGSGIRRRLTEGGVEDKYHMCVQLARCVSSMTFYDTMVYFKSDDIDETSGSIDDNMIVFDEVNLMQKYTKVQDKAEDILSHEDVRGTDSGRRMMEEDFMGDQETPEAEEFFSFELSKRRLSTEDQWHQIRIGSAGDKNCITNDGSSPSVTVSDCYDKGSLRSGTSWHLDVLTNQVLTEDTSCMDIDLSGGAENPHVLVGPCNASSEAQKWYIDHNNRLRSFYPPLSGRCMNIGTSGDIKMKNCTLDSEQQIFVAESMFPDPPPFCTTGQASTGGGTCCDSACDQCGGDGCSGQCCTANITTYCTGGGQTSCKAPTEVKLFVVDSSNCTVEIWPGSDESHSHLQSDLSLGVFNFHFLVDDYAIDSVQVRLVGKGCSVAEITRLELSHVPSGTHYRTGEFKDGGAAADHGYSLMTNFVYTFSYTAKGGDPHWIVSSVYEGPPTMAPTFGGFCTTGLFATNEGFAYCCDSDCLACGGIGCEERGGEHECCPQNITRLCTTGSDTGCMQTAPSEEPTQVPSSEPSLPPSLAPTQASTSDEVWKLIRIEASDDSNCIQDLARYDSSGILIDGTANTFAAGCTGRSESQWRHDPTTKQVINQNGGCLDIDTEKNVLQLPCKTSKDTQKWWLDDRSNRQRLRTFYGPYSGTCLHVGTAGDVKMKDCDLGNSKQDIFVDEAMFPAPASFCQLGQISSGGGTCCDAACPVCGGDGCVSQCCVESVTSYCPDLVDTGCKAPTEIKMSILESGNCTIEIWPGLEGLEQSIQRQFPSNLTPGVYSFFSLVDDSSVNSVHVRVAGDQDCAALDVTRLELIHRPSGTDYKSGEFSDGLATANSSLAHGHLLMANHLYTFDFQTGDSWEEHHWEVSSAYEGPPTMAPTFGDFCTTGILGTFEGDGYCCNSDCLTCGGVGCEERGGNHNCCPETITEFCVVADDTGCKQPLNGYSQFPSSMPSQSPSMAPSFFPTQAPTVEMGADLSVLCNELLQEFHRTTENEEIPKWEGATVGQVCLAEGTQVQVKLADAAVASADVTDFVENTLYTLGNITSGSQWSHEGDPQLVKVAVDTDGKKVGLSPLGRMWYDDSSGWFESESLVPFVSIDKSTAGTVAVDINGELFKYQSGSSDWVEVGNSNTANVVSVGRDGTVWAVRRLSSATNRLCLRDGSSWSCSSAHGRVCNYDFDGVSVADENHIYLWTSTKVLEFKGWSNGDFGVAECDNADGLTFKEVGSNKGPCNTVSVAVNEYGQEAVYCSSSWETYFPLTGREYHGWIDVLNQEEKYNSDNSVAWKRISNKECLSVSSDGYGNLWALDRHGKVLRWKKSKTNYDMMDWSNLPPSLDQNHFADQDMGSGWDVLSVAANGDVCFMKDDNGSTFKCKRATSSGYQPVEALQSFSDQRWMSIGASMDHMYVSFGSGALKRKTKYWIAVVSGSVSAPKRFLDASVTDDGWIWAIAADNKVHKKQNSAASSVAFAVASSSPANLKKISAVNETDAFALGNDAKIYDATTWEEVPSPSDVTWKELSVATDDSLWAVSVDSGIYRFQHDADNTYGLAWKKENEESEDPQFLDVGVGNIDNVFGVGFQEDGSTFGWSHKYLGIDSSFQPLADEYEALVEVYAHEILDCAADLFFAKNIRRNEFVRTSKNAGPNVTGLAKVSLSSDSKMAGLSYAGRMHFNHGGGWSKSTSSVPFAGIDIAADINGEVTRVALDVNGELFKKGDNSWDDVGTITKVIMVSVGNDGTVWAVREGNSQGDPNRLCLRAGSEWSCSGGFGRVCNYNFTSVSVGDKDHIHLVTDENELVEFLGWRNGQFGQAECDILNSLTYKEYTRAGQGHLSVAVNNDATKEAVYAIWAGTIWVVNQYAKHSVSMPWKKIADDQNYRSVSSDGNGRLWALGETGNLLRWNETATNYDLMDWSGIESQSPEENDLDMNQFFDVGHSTTGYDIISVASNGDVCFLGTTGTAKYTCKKATSSGYSVGERGNRKWVDLGTSIDHMYVSYDDNRIQRKTKAWAPLLDDSVSEPAPMRFADASVTDDGWVWAVGADDSQVYRRNFTASASLAFNATSFDPSVDSGPAGFRKIAAIDEERAYGIGSDNQIYKTTNGGASWVELPASVGVSWEALDAASDDTLLAISKEANNVFQFISNWTLVRDGSFKDVAAGSTRDDFLLAASSDLPWWKEHFVFGIGGNDPRIPCSDGNCDMSKYRIPIAVDVCEPGPSCGRDVYGQLINNEHESAGFVFKTYNDLLQDYKDCAYEQVADFDSKLTTNLEGKEDPEERAEEFHKSMKDFKDDLKEQCIGDEFAGKIDAGLQMVFGKTASPGFICGMKEAIVNRGHSMPGYCCLDAPYELEGDAWGHPYDCATATQCKRLGPYFAGLDTEACNAHGGTWCPQPADCSILADCIAEDQDLYGDEHPAYANYLSLAPRIRDTTDSSQCGRVRQYFGFDEFFLNDQAICDELGELRFSKDFSFMDEFFSSEGGGGGDAEGSDPAQFASVYEEVEVEDIDVEGVYIQELILPEVPIFDLGKVELKKANGSPAEDGQAWRATNFALSRALDIVEFLLGLIESGPEMGCEAITGLGTETVRAGCFVTIVGIKTKFQVTLFGLKQLVEVSEFTYEEVMEQGNNEPWEIFDRVKALNGRMQHTGEYIQDVTHQQNQFLKSHHKLMGKALKDHHKKIGNALEDHHNNIGETLENINDNIINGATLEQVGDVSNDVADVSNDVASLHYDFDRHKLLFDVQVEVATNTDTLKQVLLVASLDGEPLGAYDTMVYVKAFDGNGGLEELQYDGVPIDEEEEEVLVTLPSLADGSNAALYRFQVIYADYNNGKTFKQTKLVYFGDEQLGDPATRRLEEHLQMIHVGKEEDGSMGDTKEAEVKEELAKVRAEMESGLNDVKAELESSLSDIKAELAELANVKEMLSSLIAFPKMDRTEE